jgi:hypothetical protein
MPTEVFTPMASTIKVTWSGHRALNLRNMVHCFQYSGAAPTDAQLTQLCNELITNLLPKLVPISCNDLVWESVTARDMATVTGLERTVPILTGGAGTAAGFSNPGNVAYVSSWRTGRPGRRYRGRTFLTNLAEGETTGDTITSGLLSTITAFAIEFLLPRVASAFKSAVGSRVGGFSTPINGFVLDPTLDSQRRRLAGRGA